MTDFTLPLPAFRDAVALPGWVAPLRHLLRVRGRLARRRRFRHRAGLRDRDWMLALPQSRHGG